MRLHGQIFIPFNDAIHQLSVKPLQKGHVPGKTPLLLRHLPLNRHPSGNSFFIPYLQASPFQFRHGFEMAVDGGFHNFHQLCLFQVFGRAGAGLFYGRHTKIIIVVNAPILPAVVDMAPYQRLATIPAENQSAKQAGGLQVIRFAQAFLIYPPVFR